MKLQSWQQLLFLFNSSLLNEGVEESRQTMLEKFPYSVLVEGLYVETDGLEKWIELNLGPDMIKTIFYIKSGYDYGFSEYFFASQSDAERVRNSVPHIYIQLEDAIGIFRTDGYETTLFLDPQDTDAIVFEIKG